MRGLAYKLILFPPLGALIVFVLAKIVEVTTGVVVGATVLNSYKYSKNMFVAFLEYLLFHKIAVMIYLAIIVSFWAVNKYRSGSARREEAFFTGITRRFSPWRSIAFRYVAYEFAVYAGRIWRCLTSIWLIHLYGILIFTALGIAQRVLNDRAGVTSAPPEEKVRQEIRPRNRARGSARFVPMAAHRKRGRLGNLDKKACFVAAENHHRSFELMEFPRLGACRLCRRLDRGRLLEGQEPNPDIGAG